MHMKYNCKDFSSILSLSLFLSLIQHLSLKFLMRLGKKKKKKGNIRNVLGPIR